MRTYSKGEGLTKSRGIKDLNSMVSFVICTILNKAAGKKENEQILTCVVDNNKKIHAGLLAKGSKIWFAKRLWMLYSSAQKEKEVPFYAT